MNEKRNGTSRNTWLWIIAILISMGVVGGVLGPIIGHALNTPFGRGFKAGFVGALWSRAGKGGPGSKEVQAAGRCQSASIVSGNDIAEKADAGSALDIDFVICILPVGGPDPDCDDLAAVYVDAAHPTRKFMVEVKHLFATNGMLCQRTYDKSGALITNHLKTKPISSSSP